MTILIIALLAGQLTPVPATSVPAGAAGPPWLETDGSCEGAGRSVDMRRVMFLENRTLVIDGPTGPLRIHVGLEDYSIEEIGEGSARRTFAEPLDSRVEPDRDLDIELKLALVEGRLALYWRETYRNRFYRQGLLAIEGRDVFNVEDWGPRPLCEGEGGSTSRM